MIPGLIWLFTFLILPLVEWNFGFSAMVSGIAIGVMIQAALVVFILVMEIGAAQKAIISLGIVIFSFIAEYIGVSTGFPFGKYFYTQSLQPQLGNVPILIPFAWLMMLPPSWAIANRITGKSGRSYIFLLISSLAFATWDIFLDPQMVGFKLWQWQSAGQFFGIPYSNYAGWFLAAFVISFFSNYSARGSSSLCLIYVVTWLIETIGLGLFWHQPLPALAGFVGMGVFVVLSYTQQQN